MANILLLGATLIILLVLAEIVLRTTHLFGATISWSKPDPVIHYRLIPNAEYWWTKENDHPVSGRINGFGWRDVDWTIDKPVGSYRVALLGDSFVEALQVELDSTFAKIVEREFDGRVETMNFGRSGFTQTEELIVLREDVMPFEPDLVILFFYPGNDIEDVSRKTAPHTQRPFFTLGESNELIVDTSFKDTREFKMRGIANRFKRRSALAGLVIDRIVAQRAARQRRGRLQAQEKAAPGALFGLRSLCTTSPSPKYMESYDINKRLINEMVGLCRHNGTTFMIVSVNTRDYLPEIEVRLLERDPTFDVYFFDDDMGAFADIVGAEFVGLQRVFRKRFERDEEPLLWSHWNYAGHRAVADALTDKLIEMGVSEADQVGD